MNEHTATLGNVRSCHSDGPPLAVKALMWDVHNVQKPEQDDGRAAASTPKTWTNVQINRELQDVHLTLRHSKDGQGRDRLPSSWIRTVHKRGNRMEHSPPMLRQAQVRCCIEGSERQWRQERREPLYHAAKDTEDRPGQLGELPAVVVRPGGRRCWRAHCVPAWPK